jgi:hypothetical protein
VYENFFNYCLIIATTVAVIGLIYCIGRTWVGSEPSLAAGTTLGVLIGATILGVAYLLIAVLSERHSNRTTAVFLLGVSLIASLSACCALILRRSLDYRSRLGISVLGVSFGVVSTPALGLWLGMILTAVFIRGPQ